MPASHTGDHRSEAGQGRQFPARGSRGIADPPDSESGSLGRASRLAPTNFTAPKSILSDALLWYGSRLGASPGGGSNIVAVRNGRTQAPQSSQRSSEHHKPAVPRAAPGTATIFRLLAEALPTSFVRKSCRGSTGWRLHEFSSRSPTAETRRRERRQCGCKSCREHQLGLQALK